MRKLTLAACLTSAFLLPAAALACDDHKGEQKATVKNISVQELASLTKESKAVVLDANNADFRAKNGVIPGAKLLTSFKDYDPTKELPSAKDAKLVFYCANTHCKASRQAAVKAVSAGFTDVSVLPEGFHGWKQAGQPTSSQPQS